MDFVSAAFGILFIVMGLAFFFGWGHTHLTAWKRMPKEEQERINILPLCRNVGEVIMLNGLIFLMKGLWSDFSGHWFTAAIIAWLAVAALDVVYIGKSGRYQKH